MGYTLTRRPYLLIGFFHLIFGFFLLADGLCWILLTFFYWPGKEGAPASITEHSPWNTLNDGIHAAAWIVYSVQMWSGLWIMLSGAMAMGVKDIGCLERFFFFMNSVTMMVFAPAAVVLSLELLFNVGGSQLSDYSFIYNHIEPESSFFEAYKLSKDHYSWVLTFPIAGIAFGFIEFVLSIVTCSIGVCCRPTKIYMY